MGQRASRGIVGRLDQNLQKARKQMEQEALRSVEKNSNLKYSDPNALHGGFKRGDGPDLLQDAQQRAFLEQTKGKDAKEMPDDLIKFLNDVGPLERKVDKDLTSPRLRKKMQAELENSNDGEHRTKRDMPIMEDSGFMAQRTTNFSTHEKKTEEEDITGASDLDLYDMFLSEESSKEIIEKFISNKSFANAQQQQKEENLLRNTLNFIGLPVIMKDTDDSYVGAWKDHVQDLERKKLYVMSEDKIRLTLAAEKEANSTQSKENTSI
mmetsp:Transcript_11748/g.18226  ORF Transcript_11748/g.18226 Transcript_11748/m.18226 type:complete len:266 (+) Transcript_11748:122-919(+)|eukprot:CAMPEP_0195308492 /NCGR_PEP_ID=MMETSP0707-20130614/38254_1 /TAXON_ID=33640 /ORGANISM="Asterionellopsis glacialis, Strain CCMP134" /LENGTH=265 /DNA_ID=CAMNT_0040372763 /DNA_START=69 /DNA_END=866 /DNA_ORIENTATION=+